METSNRQIISVSDLNRDAKRLLESEFPALHVEGEISNLAQPGSGHWYFTLKDDRAQVRCAMFKNRNHMVQFKPRNGQKILVRGRISLYEGRGEFQMIAEFLEDSGDGALRRAFEKLKGTLQTEGLFDEGRKKPLPSLPEHIAIITSPTGAAVRDVLSVMQRRFPAIRISILPVQVQGDQSVSQIVAALRTANQLSFGHELALFDLILLTRGGGSLEDLWSFNTEPVARAIAASGLPVVCAVGHESDFSIADFVADLRAPTPSAAAELITPDGDVLLNNLNMLTRRLWQLITQQLADCNKETLHLQKRLRHPRNHLEELAQRLDELERRLVSIVKNQLERQRSLIDRYRLTSPQTTIDANKVKLGYLREQLTRRSQYSTEAKSDQLVNIMLKLNTLSPLATLQRGYAIVSSETSEHIVTSSQDLEPGDRIRARLKSGAVIAEVQAVEGQAVEGQAMQVPAINND
jgi:exodeoxyribonuclease VII large subunit